MDYQLIHGDCLVELKNLADNSVDSIVCDPPYELGFMGKSWDSTGIANNVEVWKECLRVLKPGGHLLSFGGTRTYHRMASAIEDAGFEVRDMIEWVYSTGFPKSLNLNKALQKKCKCGNMEVYDKERTKQNTEHNLRPVSETNLSQEIDTSKEQGKVLQSELSEQGVSLQQPKSTENIRGKEPFLERGNNNEKTEGELQGSNLPEMSEGVFTNGEERRLYNATQISNGSTPEQTTDENRSGASHRPQSEQQQDRKPCAFCEQLGTQEARRLYEETYGVGSSLKPAHEPICLARKPLSEKTLVDNFIKYGTGGINIDESRVEAQKGDKFGGGGLNSPVNGFMGNTNNTYKKGTGFRDDTAIGRFPANIIHDNSEEVRECFPETKSGGGNKNTGNRDGLFGQLGKGNGDGIGGDQGNASRFFKSIIYQAKASKSERNKGCEGLELKDKAGKDFRPNHAVKAELGEDGNPFGRWGKIQNNHPTVKPIALMEYLIKMVTPKGGVVLDPFMGSGSTGVACKKNGYSFIGIELNEEYIQIAKSRITQGETQT